MVLCSALCAAFSFAFARRSRMVGFSSRAIFFAANSWKAAVIASASRLLKNTIYRGFSAVVSFFRAKSTWYFFATAVNALIFLSVISIFASPAFCPASCFRLCLPRCIFAPLFFCASKKALMAFSRVCSLILAPSMIMATALPVTSSCIYSRPLRPSPYISCCTREE